MEIAISLIIYTILQIIGVGGWILIKKSSKLQKTVEKQQLILQHISDVIEFSGIKLAEIDSTGAFRSDDEVGFFFEGLKEIQQELNKYLIA